MIFDMKKILLKQLIKHIDIWIKILMLGIGMSCGVYLVTYPFKNLYPLCEFELFDYFWIGVGIVIVCEIVLCAFLLPTMDKIIEYKDE